MRQRAAVRPLRRTATAAAVGTAVGAAAHLAPGVVAWRSMRCRLLPSLAGVGDPGHVALTFDDGPDPRSTPEFLETLDRLGWKATFFCLGSQVRNSPGLAAEMAATGHEIAVHGDTHRSHLYRPATSTVADLRRAMDSIEEATGARPGWFRPPYGAVSSSTLVAAKMSGVRLVLWTTVGVDWKASSTGYSVAEHVARTFVPGATVLLHDSDITSALGSWRAALDALPRLAEAWHEAGLQVGRLGEHSVAPCTWP